MQETLSGSARDQLRRQLAAFFLATFAISWGIFGSALAWVFPGRPS
jgi:hypothetical protein